MSKAKLDAFRTAVAATNIFIVRYGYQVYAVNAATRFAWASAVKPVYSCMLFAARHKGLIPGDSNNWPRARVANFMPQWELTTEDQAISFFHLVNMISGYALPEKPGAAWAYNDYGVTMLADALFKGVFNSTPVGADALVRNTLKLGYQDGKVLGGRGGYGMVTSCRDAARLGLLWLNRGKWKSTQVLPASHFDLWHKVHVSASFPRSSAPDAGGRDKPLAADYLNLKSTGGGRNQPFDGRGRYGFFWWHNTGGRSWFEAPDDAFAAIGHHNAEVIMVLPSWSMVVAWRGRNSTPGNQFADMNRYLVRLHEAIQ